MISAISTDIEPFKTLECTLEQSRRVAQLSSLLDVTDLAYCATEPDYLFVRLGKNQRVKVSPSGKSFVINYWPGTRNAMLIEWQSGPAPANLSRATWLARNNGRLYNGLFYAVEHDIATGAWLTVLQVGQLDSVDKLQAHLHERLQRGHPVESMSLWHNQKKIAW